MAYKRTETYDGVTKMNKALYDNLQDGIDESIGTICNIAGADKYNENKIYKNGDKCIINNKIYSKKGDMANDTVLPHQFDISEWEEISIMSDIMIQMSAMQSSIEAIINGLEEKFGDGGLYMKNWRIEYDGAPKNMTLDIIAPSSRFLVVINDFYYSGDYAQNEINISGYDECEKVVSKLNTYGANGYLNAFFIYCIECNKGDTISFDFSGVHPSTSPGGITIISIY